MPFAYIGQALDRDGFSAYVARYNFGSILPDYAGCLLRPDAEYDIISTCMQQPRRGASRPERDRQIGGLPMSTSIPQTSGIYKITCLPTNKVYVGSAVDLYVRYHTHWSDLRKGTHANRYLQNAWNKYGADAFTFTVIELVLSPFLTAREQYYINRLKTTDRSKGFNIEPIAGSSLGVKRSDEYRARLSQSAKERMNRPEYKAAVSLVHKGKKLSPDQLERLHQANRGKKRPPHVMAAVIDAHSKNFTAIDPDGHVYRGRNLSAFCRDHQLNQGHLSNVALGKRKTYKGWTCSYDS